MGGVNVYIRDFMKVKMNKGGGIGVEERRLVWVQLT